MADMNYWLDRQYALLQQQAGQGQAQGANVSAGVPAGGVLPGKVSDPFAGLKAGERRDVGNWSGQNIGGVTVVSNNRPSNAAAIDSYLMRGYSLKDATAAVVGSAAAGLDSTRANLLPRQTEADIAQSRAQIGLLGAQTGLTNQQARIVVPESQARIRESNATIGKLNADTAATRDTLQQYSLDQPSLAAVRDAIARFRLSQ